MKSKVSAEVQSTLASSNANGHELGLIDNVRFENVTFESVRWESVDLRFCWLDKCYFRNAVFTACDFTTTAFCDCCFESCTFSNCVLDSAVFLKSGLTGVRFNSCRIDGNSHIVTLRDSYLSPSDLSFVDCEFDVSTNNFDMPSTLPRKDHSASHWFSLFGLHGLDVKLRSADNDTVLVSLPSKKASSGSTYAVFDKQNMAFTSLPKMKSIPMSVLRAMEEMKK